MRDTKQTLKDSIRHQEKFETRLNDIEKRRKHAIDELNSRPEFADLGLKERKDDQSYAHAVKNISEKFSVQVDDLRYHLAEIFQERRSKDLPDYNIFMAIAEDIGYDATGRETKANELEPIAKELNRFIRAIEEGKE